VSEAADERSSSWVDDESAPLLVDLYELTMAQAYIEREMTETAVFDCFARRLPQSRHFLLAAGLEDVLCFLERFRFTEDALERLSRAHPFSDATLEYLRGARFTGDVWAVPEGTPVFGDEPIVTIEAPLPIAQIVETFVLNQIHFQTMIASKAARIVRAAQGRTVVDFGLRRMHGTDAGMKAARASFIAGADATSNVLAGSVYGIPVSGTMAHSFIESYDREIDAFRDFARTWGATVLLVDTYDTLDGVRNVIRLAEELGDEFRIKAIRLDSGDLGELARRSRALLDEAGLSDVGIFVSGGLDEWSVDELVRTAPVDGFGVGSKMGVSSDAPYLDSAYKLVEYGGKPRMKLSTSKTTMPGRKQVFRVEGDEPHDVIGVRDDSVAGRPLMERVMKDGERTEAGRRALGAIRDRARAAKERLPRRLLALEQGSPAYEVRRSDALDALTRRTEAAIEGGDSARVEAG